VLKYEKFVLVCLWTVLCSTTEDVNDWMNECLTTVTNLIQINGNRASEIRSPFAQR